MKAAALHIGAVLHHTWMSVDEQGTEAAAASAVVMKRGSGGPRPTFRADHTFLFLIRDRGTGAILSLRRYTVPEQGALAAPLSGAPPPGPGRARSTSPADGNARGGPGPSAPRRAAGPS